MFHSEMVRSCRKLWDSKKENTYVVLRKFNFSHLRFPCLLLKRRRHQHRERHGGVLLAAVTMETSDSTNEDYLDIPWLLFYIKHVFFIIDGSASVGLKVFAIVQS